MPRRPWLSIAGLHNYDPEILNGIKLPQIEDLNKDIIKNDIKPLDFNIFAVNLLYQLGEYPLIYTDPEFLKPIITAWAAAEYPIWCGMWESSLYKYNPIWNKDGTITETRTRDESGNLKANDSGSNKYTNRVNSNNDSRHNVTGFDDNSYSPDTQDVLTGAENGSGESSSAANRNQDTIGHSEESYKRVEQGNIGVTTTMQMIREQREVLNFNIYDYIINSFKKRFCLLVF